MSTSGEQAGRPLTRRELRELRATGGDTAVREALDAARGPESTGSDGSVAPVRPQQNVVATSAPDIAEHPPITRRELRRLRTNEVPIVTPEDVRRASESAADPVDTDGSEWAATSEAAPDTDEGDDETVEATVDSEEIEVQATPGSDDSDPDDDVAVLSPATNSTEIPTLAPTFGAGVSERQPRERESESFDDLMGQYTQTSPSSIIMTSSHRLPEGIGSTGAAKGTTDGADVDGVLLDGELPPSSSPTPIAASAAISTQKSAHEVIRPPAPDKGRGMLLTLGITAAVLGVVAIGTLATLYFTGVFNQ